MKPQEAALLCMFAIMSFSCNDRHAVIEKKNLIVDVEIDQLSDSTYFTDMHSLVYSDGKLFCDEKKRSQVFVLDQNLNLINTIGTMGRGPKNILDIGYIAVYGDTVVVKDGSNMRMQLFHSNGDHIASEESLFGTIFWPFFRFVYWDGKYSGEARLHNNALVTCRVAGNEVRYFGDRYKFTSPKQDIIRNHRFVLRDGDYLFSVSDNVPIVDKYSYETGELLSTFDLSNIEPIRSRIKFIANEPLRDNGYSSYLTDVNVRDGKIYVLCNAKTPKDYFANDIIVLDCKDGIKMESYLHLPEEIYRSIAISDRYLYAFSFDQNKLQRFEL